MVDAVGEVHVVHEARVVGEDGEVAEMDVVGVGGADGPQGVVDGDAAGGEDVGSRDYRFFFVFVLRRFGSSIGGVLRQDTIIYKSPNRRVTGVSK